MKMPDTFTLQGLMDAEVWCRDPLNINHWLNVVGTRKAGRRVEYTPRDSREPLQRGRSPEHGIPPKVSP
jgi:hypothetical protein